MGSKSKIYVQLINDMSNANPYCDTFVGLFGGYDSPLIPVYAVNHRSALIATNNAKRADLSG